LVKSRGKKKRIDVLLVERGLVESRERAQALLMAGQVYLDGRPITKAGTQVAMDAAPEVREGLPCVGRGGIKLAHALDIWKPDVSGLVALDIGASTGGFTDCLLQRGARKVYALDVGHGQLDYRLRQDPRVVVMERVNARHSFSLPEAVDLATADVSFISLRLVLPSVAEHLKPGGYAVVLVKPQFEARREQVGRRGVVKDPHVHAEVLGKMVVWSVENGFRLRGLVPSPVLGDEGNREFFLLLQSEVE
jgi:23S rRNA (cytidine1920-2'-O)/16S rRNA (cytidine1409-2'-O)-methyltransferase